jgi:hypothetical protein
MVLIHNSFLLLSLSILRPYRARRHGWSVPRVETRLKPWAEIPPVPSGRRTIPNSPYLRAIPPRLQAVQAHGFDPVFDPLGSKLW